MYVSLEKLLFLAFVTHTHLDKVFKLHGYIYDASDGRFVATGKLDKGHVSWLNRKLSLKQSFICLINRDT